MDKGTADIIVVGCWSWDLRRDGDGGLGGGVVLAWFSAANTKSCGKNSFPSADK